MFKLSFDVATLGADIAKLRENGVAVENKGDDVARMSLAGLIAGKVTQSALVVTVLAAHGNPKTPKGKVAESLSGLRYAKGGDAARKTFAAIFDIADNAATYGDKVPEIGKEIALFVDKGDGAAKGVHSLKASVMALVKAHLQTLDPQAAEGEAKAEGEAVADSAPSAPSVDPVTHARETLLAVADYIAKFDSETALAVQEQMLAVYDAIAAHAEGKADAETELLAA